MQVFFYISGHGFGHASRALQVVNALARLEPSVRVTLRTSVPEWFLRASLDVSAQILAGEVDTGVVQPDSLSIDEKETVRQAAEFYASFDERIERERALIRDAGVDLVVGDIPPLAFSAAGAARVPSVAISNFTWDWIYGGLPEFDRLAPGMRDRIARAYGEATVALRLPFHGGFASMPHIEDAPLVARISSSPRPVTRTRLQLPDDRPIVLATFGGHGGNIPLHDAASNAGFLVAATDYEVGPHVPPHPNLRVVSAAELHRHGLTYTDLLAASDVVYTDLLAASDVVATKLGYGIVSECIANNVALLYTLRGRFVEQDVFIREMPCFVRSQSIDVDDLRAGRWSDAVEALLQQPAPPRTMRVDGAEVVATRLLAAI
jgi:hypothetical protein